MAKLEQYREHGPEGLGADALLGILLYQPEAGRALLERFGTLQALASAPFEALLLEPALGARRAQRLHAAFALGRRAAIPNRRPRITHANEVAAHFLPLLAGLRQEELHGIFVDRGGRILRASCLSRGALDSTIVDPRVILRQALEVGATGIFLAHNHPSGDPEPSLDDVRSTHAVARAAEVVGLRLLDHLVVAGELWVSMAARGALTR